MLRILLQLLLIVSLSGCYTVQETTSDNEESSRIVTNIVAETKIIGQVELEDESKGLSVKVRPVDTRKFGNELLSGKYRDGRHKTIFSSIDKTNNNENSANNHEQLINQLLDEGFSIDAIRLVIEVIEEESNATESLYVYSNPEINFSNDYMANESNPFTLDGRYLSVVEFEINNNSSEATEICSNDFIFNGENVTYRNIPTDELLSNIPSTSLRYELLHKLLMRDCEGVPANSTVSMHLVYPSFYSEEEIKVHYSNQDTFTEARFEIEHNVTRNQYSFSSLKIEGSQNKGYRVLDGLNSENTSNPTKKRGDFYHFIKNSNSLRYIGFNEFFIHDEIDLSSVEIISVEYQNNNDVNVFRTSITEEDITRGLISLRRK